MQAVGLNWIFTESPITWDQANSIALQVGGSLLIDTYFEAANGGGFRSSLSEAAGDNTLYEEPTWFGITAVPGGYQWIDGTPVTETHFS